jgi:hypothetical protein
LRRHTGALGVESVAVGGVLSGHRSGGNCRVLGGVRSRLGCGVCSRLRSWRCCRVLGG